MLKLLILKVRALKLYPITTDMLKPSNFNFDEETLTRLHTCKNVQKRKKLCAVYFSCNVTLSIF